MKKSTYSRSTPGTLTVSIAGSDHRRKFLDVLPVTSFPTLATSVSI